MSTPPVSVPSRLRVDIWSDIACPWCYIGKRRFERALSQFADAPQVEVVWHSFELDPAAPAQDDRSLKAILGQKYGLDDARAQGMLDGMTATAAAEGLEYHLGRARPANTFLAHQLLHLAAEAGLQDAMKERLLHAYFSEGEHVGQLPTLLRLAAEVGLDVEEARAALEAGTYAAAVRQDQAQAHAYGIQGVPFFVLDGQFGVSGAQAPDTLLSALRHAQQQRQPLELELLGQHTPAEACEDGRCAVPQSSGVGH